MKISFDDISLQNDKIYEAISLYIQSLNLEEIKYKQFVQRGNLFQEVGNNEESIIQFCRYYEINNGCDFAKYFKAISYQRIGNLDDALQILNEIVHLYSNFCYGYLDRGIQGLRYFKGNVYLNMGNNEKALQDYNQAIQLSPSLHIAYFNRGIVQHSKYKMEEALEDFTKVIELNSSDASAYFNRGTILLSQQKINEAIKDYEEAVKINPHDAIIYFTLKQTVKGNGGIKQCYSIRQLIF